MRAIHDYLCKNLTYQENAYAHTAAGVFLKNKKVVCEGYAKAFKILCGKFGYKCALVSGVAQRKDGGTEAHMWNYIRMNDGKWYLVDVTWDDQVTWISDSYFLAGSSCKGFNAVISEERIVYPNFSGAALTKSFTVPALSGTAYGETCEHKWETTKTIDKQPTCTEKGSKSLHCEKCGESKPGSEEAVSTIAHTESNVKVVKAATCKKEGEASYTCSVCGKKCTKTLPRTAHKWNTKKTVDRKSTCTVKGQKSIHCSVCNAVKPGTTESIALASHSYGAWKVTKQATAVAAGTKQRTCTVCKKAVQKASIAKLKATIKVNVTSVVLKKGQSASVVKVSGLAKGDSVKSWTSSNTKLVTVHKTKGTIKAVKTTGKKPVTITITLASGLKKNISVTVQSGTVKTTKISCAPGSVTLKKGAKTTLKPVLAPLTSQEKVTYTSSNKKVAVVSSSGVVTAKGAGTAKITIKSGKKSCTVKVTVPTVKTQKLAASASFTLKKGQSGTLSVKVTPANSDEALTYSSSNSKIVSVSKTGKVTAKKKGTAVITIRSGKAKTTCKITVK